MTPDWNAYVRQNLPPLGLTPERESEIAAELAGQLEQAFRDAQSAGATDDEAAARARLHIRDWASLAAELRASHRPVPPPLPPQPSGPWLAGLWHDVRYAARKLRQCPAFALIAIATLAFGIGGNTAVFTVVDHIALRGLPYPDPARLLDIEHTKIDQPEVDPWCSIDNLLDFRKRTQAFQSIEAVSPVWNVVLQSDAETERLETLYVSAGFFPMLGVNPALGRLFQLEDDDRAHPAPVAVLSYDFWKRRFAASPSVVGQSLRIDSSQVTVIGVLPEDFRWRGEPLRGTATNIDMWMPLASNQLARSPRTLRFLKVTGRLKPGVSFDQGRDEVRRTGAALTTEFAEANRNLSFDAVPLESKVTAKLRPAVNLLLATVGFVLLMASANVANLLLARASARRQELAVRVALGASSGRLLRQMLTESAVLAALGALAGLAVAKALLILILAYGPPAMLKAAPITLDLRALGFTAAIGVATALLAGLVPAWRAVMGNSGSAVREGRGITKGNRAIRAALATAQLTIALVLLIGAGLLIRSFLRVLAVPPGFDAHNVITISTQLPGNSNSAQQRMNIYNEIRDQLLSTPGVASVGAVSRLPMLGQNLASLLYIEGQDNSAHPPEVEFRAATPDYFTTMRIPLRSGRLFERHDRATQFELIIDDVTADRYFPGADPIGKRIRFLADSGGPWFTIIGVVGSTRHFGLETAPRPTIYRDVATNPLGAPIFVIRTASDPTPMLQTLSRIVRTAHGRMPTYNVFPMEQLVARSTAERRFLMWLLTSFAAAALFLAGIGIYGAIAQSVAQRTQEIGVRVALGASPADTLRLVFLEGLQIAAAGVPLGLLIAVIAARLGRTMLFSIQPYDPLVFITSVCTLLTCVALGCYLPARYAMGLDPLVALRLD